MARLDPRTSPVPLGALRAGDAPWAGGKGARLGELSAAGFPVPPGLVLPATAPGATGWNRGEPVPGPVAAAVIAAYRQLGASVPVAVRSSAPGEDRAGDSHAGHYRSVLGVVGADAVLDAIATCWASADAGPMPVMGVVIQAMVDAEVAGVVFSADPEHPTELVVECAPGLGTAVVEGVVDPDRTRLRRRDLRPAATPQVRHAGRTLGPTETREVGRLALAVEEHFGSPQDVEWAVAGGRLHLLQARPLVALAQVPSTGPPSAGRAVVSGEGIGATRVVGHVRRLDDPAPTPQFRPGDVLVTAATTPAWLPLVRLAGAVVTDVGGVTSHAAVVCRELGVPAVVGTGSSTTLLLDGQLVEVDPIAGEVRLSGR